MATVAELKAMAKQAGLKRYSNLRKNELLALLGQAAGVKQAPKAKAKKVKASVKQASAKRASKAKAKKAKAKKPVRKPCRVDQVRNPKSGRCVKRTSKAGQGVISSVASRLQRAFRARRQVPVVPVAAAAAVVKSPAKSTAQPKAKKSKSTKAKKPCKKWQKRNPSTGRCRYVIDMSLWNHNESWVDALAAGKTVVVGKVNKFKHLVYDPKTEAVKVYQFNLNERSYVWSTYSRTGLEYAKGRLQGWFKNGWVWLEARD